MTSTETRRHTMTLPLAGAGPVDVSVDERGAGQPFLLLHGGAGPESAAGFAEFFAAACPVRVITPTHPGFGGTSRPGGLDSIRKLASVYDSLLAELDITDVTVIGNSIGGWTAAELALLGSPRVSGVVLVDAVGIEVPDHPVADAFTLSLDQVVQCPFNRGSVPLAHRDQKIGIEHPAQKRRHLNDLPDRRQTIQTGVKRGLQGRGDLDGRAEADVSTFGH